MIVLAGSTGFELSGSNVFLTDVNNLRTGDLFADIVITAACQSVILFNTLNSFKLD